VVKYEHLVADPEGTLAQIATFLDLKGDIPSDGIDTRRSATYERKWTDLTTTGPWRREHFRRLGRRHEPSANHFGYSLLDLAAPTRSQWVRPAPPEPTRPHRLASRAATARAGGRPEPGGPARAGGAGPSRGAGRSGSLAGPGGERRVAQPEARRARRASRRSAGTATLASVPVPMRTSGLWWPW
jgi:hypothetical protein